MEINGKNIDMDTFCIMPFLSVNNKWSGQITPCCHFNYNQIQNSTSSNINDKTFTDIFNSSSEDFYNNIRRDFLDNKKISSCDTCWKQEAKGIVSLRNHKNIIYRDFINEENILNPKIRHLELCVANLCNLACVHCWPGNSNQIEKEWNKFENIPIIDQKKFSFNTSDIIEEDLHKMAPDLRRIDWSGGEPLLNDLYHRYIDYLVKNNYSKHIHLFHNSNGTVYKQDLINYWKHFKQVEITFSIDGIGDKFEYMRYPGKWNNFLKNMDRYKELKMQQEFVFDMRFLITVSSLNIMEVPAIIELLEPYGTVALNFLFDPEYFAAYNLPQHMKDKINDYYNNLPSTIRDHVCCKEAVGYLNRDIEKQLCRDIHGIEREPILNLRDRLSKLDQRRNNSYKKSFPESYKILFDK